MGGRPLWQAEIGRIIARTEENLRAPRTGPPLYKVPRVAEAAFTAPLLHASFMTSAASAEERRTPAPAATVPIEPSPPPSASVIAALTSGLSGEARTVATRLLEHTRADIDLRSNLAGRHAQALREELAHGLHEAERRWVDLAKEIEATVSGAIEAERQLRAGGEEKTTRLEASVAATRKELLGLIGDGQAELVEQGGVLRQVEQESELGWGQGSRCEEEGAFTASGCEQELLAFKAETEVALAEEGKRLSALAERQRELETALLKERELRKAVEAELGELRCSVAQERDRLPAEIEAAVAREVALSGGGAAAVAALEDKVKECGRLLLRMGGDLMEEGRRRQAIEAEVQELRLRLSSVEVVSHPAVRSPLGMGGAPPPDLFAMSQAAPSGSPPALSRPAACEAPAQQWVHPLPEASVAEALSGGGSLAASEPPSRPAGAVATWSAATSSAVDSALCRFARPGQGGHEALSASASYAQLVARGIAPPLTRDSSLSAASPSSCELLPSAAPTAAAALRMTREQLDARVQQILGKHGALAAASRATASAAL
ncbi:hypothetical protein EMIHUDRAFT_457590 [Emiliania huxleyi CCMP1516]|uniref:Uncharacterized protein n=2 Tax=Emiliania huxleyi TaxID=2903 RepID=A0A0D3JP90_EMIH1|nr:hypothetical protein EMIHUDRAFT_457590 [Emiliania huxleyi CCMP1516]EOD25325.1 hypothetical protein EMIHUDRAFT_457590 [Emiliania huxleyi CCMP1516]|eukprot:XP_005777754.1 hypothetical protein EMIHUDRAFT_457590 [Emiliania huxleyi CCMP1516]